MPAFCAVNGLSVAEGAIFIPRLGVWHGDLSIDSSQAVSGRATIQLGSQTLVGTFARAGFDLRGRLQVRVVGGAGGLAKPLAPKSYGSIPLKVVLQDALSDAGEVLSVAADATLLATQLTAWSRMAAPASSVIDSVLQAVPGAVWRVLLDGSVWCGFETWPTSSLPDAVPVKAEPELGRITIATLSMTLLPGTSFQYQVPRAGTFTARVGYVQHHIRRDEIRTVLLTETDAAASDRSKAGLAAFIRSVVGLKLLGPRFDYLAAYQCKAVSQNADGTLELQPDDARLPGYSKVPIRYGVPGVTATIASGARVLLEFAGGDPQKPIATVWESASVTALNLTASGINLGSASASHPLIYGDDFSTSGSGSAFDTLMQAIATNVGTSGSPAGATAAAAAIVIAITAYRAAVASKLSANKTT